MVPAIHMKHGSIAERFAAACMLYSLGCSSAPLVFSPHEHLARLLACIDLDAVELAPHASSVATISLVCLRLASLSLVLTTRLLHSLFS
jgi:hypothetical protein